MRIERIVLAGVLLLAALPVLAQTNPTGTISGKVGDDQGLALPGVNVTAQSRTLQGTRSATSSANGDYIIPFLPAGEYTVTFELTGFQTLKRAVRVKLAETVPLDVRLGLSAVAETMTVMAEAPGDFSQSPRVATSFKAELIEELPLNRTLISAVTLAPGVQQTGPTGAIAIAGAPSFQSLFMINGVVIQENLRGQPLELFIEDAIQETTTSTGAISAEFGRFGGGVVNAITKSGGNEFSGSFRTTFENDDWVALTPFPNDRRVDDMYQTYEATLGGPVVKDRLWFFGAARFLERARALTTNFTNLTYDNVRDTKRYEGKLTYSINANHTFRGAYTRIDDAENGNSFGVIMDLDSLVNRTTPQQLLSLNYTGVISPSFFVEAQFSRRQFTFRNSGSQYQDLIRGTLIQDQQRNLSRFWSPTFCGVCDDENRDNRNIIAKASYFLSTKSLGSHNFVGGLDVFDDERFANNYQSGSSYRILATTSIIQGGNVFPVFNNDRTTVIQWNPILVGSEGNGFRTYSGFLNDTWRLDDHLTFNLGLRYDKNDGEDATGVKVVKDAAFSPRFSVSYDPGGDGTWTINAGYGKYVTAVANSVADAGSAGGRASQYQFDYLGPAVNVGNPANPIPSDRALQVLFDWFNANGGTNRSTRGAPTISGLTTVISGSLASPSVRELTAGFSRRLGRRGLARVDGVYRTFRDFYVERRDLTTGRVTDPLGRAFDRSSFENDNDFLDRSYKGVSFQVSYRVDERLTLGGNYTLSSARGNTDAENVASGPVQSQVRRYPEYIDPAWFAPEGYVSTDQRHKARMWATWDIPAPAALGRFTLGLLQRINSGVPYEAIGQIDPKPFVTNPGYLQGPTTVDYFFTERGAFRTKSEIATDLNLIYSRRLGVRKLELFARGTVINVFNQLEVTNLGFQGGGASCAPCINLGVTTRSNSSTVQAFNPFTTEPVEGVHWRKNATFGQPTNRLAYQTPRTINFSLGLRF